MRQFGKDEDKGQKAVNAFTKYLDSISHKWRPATEDEQFKGIDVVATAQGYGYEVKYQKYSGKIIIEESDGLREGWIYTSQSDAIVEVSNDFKRITYVKTEDLRNLYELIKKNYTLRYNEVTKGLRGDEWQGSFRIIPVNHIQPFIKVVKRRIV